MNKLQLTRHALITAPLRVALDDYGVPCGSTQAAAFEAIAGVIDQLNSGTRTMTLDANLRAIMNAHKAGLSLMLDLDATPGAWQVLWFEDDSVYARRDGQAEIAVSLAGYCAAHQRCCEVAGVNAWVWC